MLYYYYQNSILTPFFPLQFTMQVVDRVNGMHLKRYHNTAEENPPSDSGTDEQPPVTICSADEEPHPTDPDPSDAGSFPDDSFSDDSVPPSPSPMPSLQTLIKQLQVSSIIFTTTNGSVM